MRLLCPDPLTAHLPGTVDRHGAAMLIVTPTPYRRTEAMQAKRKTERLGREQTRCRFHRFQDTVAFDLDATETLLTGLRKTNSNAEFLSMAAQSFRR